MSNTPALALAKRGGPIDVTAIASEVESLSDDDVRQEYWDMGTYPKTVNEHAHQAAVRAVLFGELQRRGAIGRTNAKPTDEPPRRRA